MAMDLICQETRGCVLGELRVAGFPLFTVFTVPEKFSRGTVIAAKPSSHRGRSVTIKGRDVVREVMGEGT